MLSENQTLLDPLRTPQQINQRHREFFREQSDLRAMRFSDTAIRELANEDMQSETMREVPLRSRKSFEQALADAEWRLNFARRDLSRKGGKAAKLQSCKAAKLQSCKAAKLQSCKAARLQSMMLSKSLLRRSIVLATVLRQEDCCGS
jgi:hypothetical protein